MKSARARRGGKRDFGGRGSPRHDGSLPRPDPASRARRWAQGKGKGDPASRRPLWRSRCTRLLDGECGSLPIPPASTPSRSFTSRNTDWSGSIFEIEENAVGLHGIANASGIGRHDTEQLERHPVRDIPARMVRDLRKSQGDRIVAQRNPDGGGYAPRGPKREAKPI